MNLEERRNKIKEEFKFYLSRVARSSRVTDGSFYLSSNAVNSYLAFLEVDKLFDYAPEKWSNIKSIYDITNATEIEKVASKLLNDPDFVEQNKGKNNGWRSGSIMHYVCFINARTYFENANKKEIDNNPSLLKKQNSILPSQIIYYGAPGTGKSHSIKLREEAGLKCIRTTFHPDSDYSTFVGCYKPHKNHGELTYEFVEQAFLVAYKQAWLNPDEEIALVIEEINRGNCAQVFGDIFQLLDRSEDGWSTYPIKADTDIADYLEQMAIPAYSETMAAHYGEDKAGYGFLALPPNMSILATMNTSDQSLFPIDSAFKRRWDWKYVKIKDCKKGWNIQIKDEAGNVVLVNGKDQLSWWSFIQKINEIIASMTSSADKQLGYFFCKPTVKANEGDEKPTIITADTLVGKVLFYLWNDVFKDYGFEDGYLFRYQTKEEDKVVEKDLAFADFYDEEGEHVDTARLADFLNKVMTWQKKNEGKE